MLLQCVVEGGRLVTVLIAVRDEDSTRGGGCWSEDIRPGQRGTAVEDSLVSSQSKVNEKGEQRGGMSKTYGPPKPPLYVNGVSGCRDWTITRSTTGLVVLSSAVMVLELASTATEALTVCPLLLVALMVTVAVVRSSVCSKLAS